MNQNNKKKIDSKHIVIRENNTGQRIDNFLIRYLEKIPKSRIYQMIRKGEVRVNSGRVKQTYKIKTNDRVRIPPIYFHEKEIFTIDSSFQKNLLDSIIFEDEGILAINKPAGAVVHGGTGQSHSLIQMLRSIEEYRSLELVHRLDKDTSGCLLFAKNIPILRELQAIFQNNKGTKTYRALLHGHIKKNKLTINKPLKKNFIRSGERIVTTDSDGKPASTIFFLERSFKNASLVKIRLLTGRTHQIRVHSAYMGNFVLGDKKYGNKTVNHEFKQLGLKRMFLHSESLNFMSPITKKRIIIEAKIDNDLSKFLEYLN